MAVQKGNGANLMSLSISENVKRVRVPKRQYRKSIVLPSYLSEELHREASHMGVTSTTLALDALERGLSLMDKEVERQAAA
jgi:hypothetical protein